MVAETVLITGCSSGIGRETARLFHEEGWTVYATARDPEDIADLEALGCETAALDVTDDGQIQRLVKRIVENEGRLDCLVNNAGYGQVGPVEDVPPEKVQAQFDVNVFGPHRLIRAVLPHMREREEGRIVNVSSIAGRVATPGMGVYNGSKFALEAMSDALRAEVAPFGVDVVLVEPGPVDTGFADRAAEEAEAFERSEDAYPAIYRMLDDTDAVGGGGPFAVRARTVAEAIYEGASVPTPDVRYPVGAIARYGSYARWLPDGIRDSLYGLLNKALSNRLVN